jgi:hypothetical protein
VLGGKPTALLKLNQDILRAEEAGNGQVMAPLLQPDFKFVRADGTQHDRDDFLKSMRDNGNRGRSAADAQVRMVGQYAVYTCVITTTHDAKGTPHSGRFWNTRLFVNENGAWRCAAWQVLKLTDA